MRAIGKRPTYANVIALDRNSTPFREMVEIDYAYVTSWTFWGDVKLLARTVPVVLRRKGSN